MRERKGFLNHLISAPNTVLFNSEPKPTSKCLKGHLILKIALNITPSSSEPAGKVKQMAFIDKFIYLEGATSSQEFQQDSASLWPELP